MTLVVYNTLSKKKEDFVPLDPNEVKLYLCGPTVYDLLHIGNFRGIVVFNCLRHWLEEHKYNVKFVLNYTDIDDKIIKRANENNKSTEQLTQTYITAFQEDCSQLGITPHDINPKCSAHINDMIEYITKLIKKDHAYHIDGSVFFRIESFPDYGKLSGKNIDDLNAGHRVDPDPRKENPLDFILWKPAKPEEPAWESPWGPGRPGWHIECSAMNHAHHGDQIDIHGGGIDLIFPHHENEIAQSEACTGKPFAKYWMHNNFIQFGSEKMSKSLGNVIKARDYMNQYHPEILNFLLLSVHYRSKLTIDQDQTLQTIQRLARIYTALKTANELATDNQTQADKEFMTVLENSQTKFKTGLDDDLNTPIAFAAIFELIRQFNHETSHKKQKNPLLKGAAHLFLQQMSHWGQILNLFNQTPTIFLTTLNTILISLLNIDAQLIETLIEQRNEARKTKNFEFADKLRQELLDMQIEIQDTPTKTYWNVKC